MRSPPIVFARISRSILSRRRGPLAKHVDVPSDFHAPKGADASDDARSGLGRQFLGDDNLGLKRDAGRHENQISKRLALRTAMPQASAS